MLLALWFLQCILLIAIGSFLLLPKKIIVKMQRKLYCSRCHEDITRQIKFNADQEIQEDLSSRLE